MEHLPNIAEQADVRSSLSTQVETWAGILDEVKPLFERHYDEISLHRGRFPLNPQYDEYARREAADGMLVVTLRSMDELVGYAINFVTFGLHYADCLTLFPDIFYVAPEARGQMGGVKLFRAVEAEARKIGVDLMMAGTKNHKDSSALFKRLGFGPIETIHAKWLDG